MANENGDFPEPISTQPRANTLISLSFLYYLSQWIMDGARGHAEREPSAVIVTTK